MQLRTSSKTLRNFMPPIHWMVAIFSLPMANLLGQSPASPSDPFFRDSTSQRSYGGWKASLPNRQQGMPNVAVQDGIKNDGQSPQWVQHASFFQSQGANGFPSVFPHSVAPPPLPNQPEATSTGLRERNDLSTDVDSGLRPTGEMMPGTHSFTTGLPFVTQAPGRYPTSPYTGPSHVPTYQTIGYQRSVPVTFAAQTTAGASQVVLPQHQQPVFSANPNPGIYPTAYQQCQVLPPPSLPPDGAIGTTYVPPTATPNWNSNMYSANNAGLRPLISLGQESNNVVLGRGIIGQPTAYVPNQPIRNFLRYLSP